MSRLARSGGSMGFAALTALLAATSSSAAWAQGSDSWTLAQQAFARSDHATAFKHAVDTVARQPQNQEARRMAARSARELEKFVECLRFMAEIPQAQISSDDVGIVGDCSARSTVSPRVLTFLQQQLANPDNREMAAFWLGRHAFQKEDYKAAERHLSSIQLLPDRLEKERSRMLEKIREAARPQVVPVTPSPVAEKPAAVKPRARPADAEGRTGGSVSFRGEAVAEGQFRMRNGKVATEPFSQPAYESRFTADAIEKRDVSETRGALSSVLDLGAAWRARTGDGFLYGLGVKGVVAGTASNVARWIYEPPGATPYPTSVLGERSRGVDLRLEPTLELGWSRTVEARAGAGVRMNAVKANRLRLIPFLGFEAAFRVEHFSLIGGYDYERVYGTSGGVGLIGVSWRGDARIERLGPFSLRPPEGFSLIRYARSMAFGSREMVRFLMVDGDFFEVNVAPRLRLAPTVELGGWLRYLSGSSRQYWSGPDLRRWYGVRTSDDLTTVGVTYEPSAMYTSNSVDASALLAWLPATGWSIEGGLGWHRSGTQYQDFVAVDLDQRQRNNRPTPGQFRDLLDNGGESGLRFFSTVSYGF